MKLVLATILLAASCGSYEAKLTQEKSETGDHDGETDSGKSDEAGETATTKDSADKPLENEGDNGPVAIAFGDNVKLEGVSEIYSASKIIDTLYFTGKDDKGNHVLGRMKPDETSPTLLPVAKMNANNISLSGQYTLPSNADGNLFLMNGTEIIEVDLTTMLAVGKVLSQCAAEGPLTFSRNNRWNTIWNGKLDVCGMVDGATIDERKAILDGYTGETLAFDNYSRFMFDGIKLYRYQFEQSLLVVYDANFTKEVTYSTGGYLYNSKTSSFVSDNNGNRWFFGCASGECFRTEATLTAQ